MVFRINIFVLLWISAMAALDAARILAVFPLGSRSRFAFAEALMKTLHDTGHQITLVTPFANEKSLKNYTIIDSSYNSKVYVGTLSMDKLKNEGMVDHLRWFAAADENNCDGVLELKEIQNVLNSNEKPYDVMFVNVVSMHECYLPLAEKLDIPVIGTVTLRSWKAADALIGNPYNLATIPFEMIHLSRTMSFGERLQNTWYWVLADLFQYFVVQPKMDRHYKKYYPAHLWYKKKLSLIFYNSHATILPRPLVPNAIEIGGIHVAPANALPPNIQNFIDGAENGVILFTLGSVVKCSTLSPQITNAFKEAFASIPQRVIWKYEEKIDQLPENVLTLGWLPQRDILAHKNVKVFIGHCGVSGVYESIFEGTPMVLLPLYADQISNARILEELGVGFLLDVYSATKETVLDALNAVINDTGYGERMRDLSRKYKDRPMTPQESVAYWTEYVIKHKGAHHLRTVAADMPFYQYFLLDIIFVVTTIAAFVIYAMYYVVKMFFQYFRNKKQLSELDKKKD